MPSPPLLSRLQKRPEISRTIPWVSQAMAISAMMSSVTRYGHVYSESRDGNYTYDNVVLTIENNTDTPASNITIVFALTDADGTLLYAKGYQIVQYRALSPLHHGVQGRCRPRLFHLARGTRHHTGRCLGHGVFSDSIGKPVPGGASRCWPHGYFWGTDASLNIYFLLAGRVQW